ncbi:beta-ketoacyl synthase N-terminal-like domain-containing protein [Plantactinospora soyae]|uniref:3-oxoacyl-[acyl-carrier-protein] synthase II n=1 Tax=Plantactinospora soyae TaxID=1544732 RepID=A0A927MF98_9ACTN|nr:beta-ketoacyl synthase N-terminal-like domain-containing protein [Plantactinospora soyae]MBE1491996.1 3-oxoacyl-[acyl-carrier-protein] synthase II [Plantactinospora soyae]
MIATTIAGDELVLSGWSAASAFGLGADRFADGVRAGTDAVAPLDRAAWPGPYDRAGLIPGFDIPELLGRKGTRSMDRATGIAIATVGMLLDQCGPELVGEPERIGLVLGTSSGSVQSIMDFTRESLTGARPFHVDPARFPNTVMNRAAGQSAIWYGLKGPNTTIAGGSLTGLLALNYAVRLQRGGHSDLILCGAVEEYSVQRGWLEWHGREGVAAPLGEGCAIFLLEPLSSAVRDGRRPLATVRGSRFRAFSDPAAVRPVLGRCIGDALGAAGLRPEDVRVVAASDAGNGLAAAEEAAIADVLGANRPTRLHCRALLGDTSSASSAFQLAAALSELSDRSDGVALVTGVDRDGQVGATLLGAVS